MKKINLKNNLKKFFNSYKVIIIFLFVILGISLYLTNHVMKANKIYMFNGKSDYITILNGVVALNYDMNLLMGSDINYNQEEDVTIYKYTIGYYVMVNGKLSEIAVIKDENENGFSLKKLIESHSNFNLTEPYNNKYFFTKNKVKAISDLYFIINADLKDNHTLYEKLKLDLTKITK